MTREQFRGMEHGWREVQIDDKEYNNYCKYNYEGFVDSLLVVEGRVAKGAYKELSQWEFAVGKECKLQFDDPCREFIFTVLNLHVYLFPFGVVLYAIEIESDGVDLNDLTMVHKWLRDVGAYVDNSCLRSSGYIDAIQPLLNLCRKESSFADLTYTGNKLKIFQIVGSDNLSEELLYELGTISPIGAVCNHLNRDSPSEEYYNSIINSHKISVYKNWIGLAIFDTVTFLTSAAKPQKGGFDVISQSYYRLIYLHALYQKTLLFCINQEFRAASVNRGDIHSLVRKMKDQEYYYAFSNISYNFLPQLIYEKILGGLDVASERSQLKYYLDQEEDKRDKTVERNMNLLLFIIAILSLFSALYDGSSMIRELWGWQRMCEYQTIVCALLAFVLAFVLLVIFSPRILRYIRVLCRK